MMRSSRKLGGDDDDDDDNSMQIATSNGDPMLAMWTIVLMDINLGKWYGNQGCGLKPF